MLSVRFDGDKYIAKLSYSNKKTVERAGFLWDKDLKKYTTHNVRAAYRLYESCDIVTRDHIREELDIPSGKIPHIEIVHPGRLKPYAHQIEFTRWVLSRRSSYIAGEAGTGKTPVLPLCMNTSPGKALVICPSFLKYNWEDELENWSTEFKTIQILTKMKDDIDFTSDVIITPDSLIHNNIFRQKFFEGKNRFKYLFIDEAHRFKTKDARRTKSLLGSNKVKVKGYKGHKVWKGFHHISDHVVAMSGTPMPNRPFELYALIARHAPHAVNFYDPHRFGVTFCAGHETDYGWDYTGSSNLEELHTILNRNYMIVKRLKDCVDLPDKLPPKFIYIEDNRGDFVKDEMTILKRFKVTDLIRMEAERSAEFRQSLEDKLEDTPELGPFGFISQLRLLTGLRKVRQCIDGIKDLLLTEEKIVVFCWHKEVVKDLVSKLKDYQPLKITGEQSARNRHDQVKLFQHGKKHRIIVCNIQAGGVGFTMTAAQCVVFVEPSWVPGENEQAINRVYRISQAGVVRPYFFVYKNSLDHLILNAHQDKSHNIKSAIKPRIEGEYIYE